MTIEYKDSKRIITSPASASYWDFDGTNDYVQMPTIPTGYTFAVSMWVRKDSSGRMAFMVDNDTNGIWLEDANAGSVRLRVGHSQSGSDFDTSTAFPEDGNFHHLVFNVGTPNQIWLDGVSLGTGGTANSTSTNWIPAMGARNSSSTTDRFLDGAMSKVGIWDRKLTDAEVASLYAEAEPSTISSGLLATYNFEQTGNTLEDQTNSYDGTNNGATSGSTRDVPETKPTDVQDNSLLVEKDTARRYWFTSEVSNLTFEDDFSGADNWSKSPSDSQFAVDTSDDRLEFLENASSGGDRCWYDLGAGAVSSTKWLFRAKFRFTTIASQSDYPEFDFGLSDNTVNSDTQQNFMGFRCLPMSLNNLFRPRVCTGASGDAGKPRRGASASYNPSPAFTTGKDYYVEIKRTSASNWSCTLSNTNAFDGDIVGGSFTDAGSVTDLRYIKIMDGTTATSGDMAGYVDDVEFYNGATTPTEPATWTMEPTLEYDLSTSAGWTTTGSNCSVNTSGQYLEGSSSTNDDRATKALGLTLSDTKFVVRQKMELTTVTSGGNGQLYFGYTDKDNSTTVLGNRDGIGITIRSSPDFLQSYALNQAWQSSATLSTTPTATTYYLEIIRNSATSYTLNLYSDSNYSVLVETKTNTISSSINGLEYITIGGWDNNASGVITARFSDIQIYNGVTSIN